MEDALDVVMPILNSRVYGRLHHVASNVDRGGVLLLDANPSDRASYTVLYDEFELYLRSAGLTCLRVSGYREQSVRQRSRELLAGVTYLLSLGLKHVILIVSSGPALAHPERVSAETLEDVLEEIEKQGHTMPDMLRAVQSMVTGIRQICDSVVGVATLMPREALHDGLVTRRKYHVRQRVRLVPSEESELSRFANEAETVSINLTRPAILLSTPEAAASPDNQQRTELLGRLYMWVTTTLAKQDTVLAPANAPTKQPEATPGRAKEPSEWQQTQQWLEERWDQIIDTASLRMPEQQGDLRRRVDQLETSRTILDRAHAMWNFLDNQAKLEWLTVCGLAFTSYPPFLGEVSTDTADAAIHSGRRGDTLRPTRRYTPADAAIHAS